MKCNFERKTAVNSEGSYTLTTCINKADITIGPDPCYGLCYQHAYLKLQAELEKQRIELEFVKAQLSKYISEPETFYSVNGEAPERKEE